MDSQQLYSLLCDFSSSLRQACGYCRQKENLHLWYISFYPVNFSYHLFLEYRIPDYFPDISGYFSSSDLRNQPGNSDFRLRTRRARPGNGYQYNCRLCRSFRRTGNRGTSDTIFRMEKHFWIPRTDWTCFSFTLSFRKMKPEWIEAKGERFDWKGSVIYGIAMASAMYGFSKLPSAAGWLFLGSGILTGLLFLFL